MKTKQIMKLIIALGCATLLMYACQKDDETKPQAPEIALDNPTAIYQVKIGKTIKIAPIYKHTESAVFVWKMDGTVIGTSPELNYTGNELGDKYLSLSAINNAGEAYAEMKISVLSLLLPKIQLTVPSEGFTIIKGSDLTLNPTLQNCETATFTWTVDGKTLGTANNFTFNSATTGNFKLRFTATNEDGNTEITIPIKVCNAEDMPFSWAFEQTHYNISQGRRIRIKIWDITNAFDAQFTWAVNGVEKQTGNQTFFVFNETSKGTHTVTVTMKNAYAQLSQQLTVTVCEPEGTYKRSATAGSSPQWNKVYEFLAAPGQFVNERYTATTMTEAAAYAENRLNTEAYVSLGGFGGYIVVGFDHSVENDNNYNIQIKGNSFAGSSEPGIVWVMQDENGNGLPDDTWYELKGCEYGKATEIRDYAITYYKPKAPGMSVQWTDNQGASGMIDYLGFHQQDYYYPNWVTTDSYTLRGTCLPASNRETSPGYWYNGEFEWGYADNFSSIDRLTNDINYGAAANGNHFRISDAVTFDGQPANLKYIDFVKVVTGVNCKSGWLGEVSTEVFNIKDFNLIKGKTRNYNRIK